MKQKWYGTDRLVFAEAVSAAICLFALILQQLPFFMERSLPLKCMRLLERFFNAEASFTGFVLAEAMCTSLDSGAASTAEVVFSFVVY